MQHNDKSAKCNILFGLWSQTGSLTASPDYWDQKVDLCHFALRNISCCHWSDLWDNLNTIEHKQKSLKSAFIWRHLKIMVQIHSNQFIWWHRVLLGTYLDTLCSRWKFPTSEGVWIHSWLCWSEVAIWHLPLRSRLHSTRALTRPAQTTQWMLYFI